jgi:hypothetical protein
MEDKKNKKKQDNSGKMNTNLIIFKGTQLVFQWPFIVYPNENNKNFAFCPVPSLFCRANIKKA